MVAIQGTSKFGNEKLIVLFTKQAFAPHSKWCERLILNVKVFICPLQYIPDNDNFLMCIGLSSVD